MLSDCEFCHRKLGKKYKRRLHLQVCDESCRFRLNRIYPSYIYFESWKLGEKQTNAKRQMADKFPSSASKNRDENEIFALQKIKSINT